MNPYARITAIAVAGLAFALPGFAQKRDTPDARAGAVVVETLKPLPQTVSPATDGTIQPVVIVGGRSRRGARPPGKTNAGPRTTAPSR